MPGETPRPTPAAAVVVLRDKSVLLIRRGRAPNAGIWSFPGGRVEPGETVRETAVREAREETGIEVELVEVADVVDVIVPATEEHPALHYVITDFLAVSRGDVEPRPGDDAAEARWVPLSDIDRYALTPAMRAVLDRALLQSSSVGAALRGRPLSADEDRQKANQSARRGEGRPRRAAPTRRRDHGTVHDVGEFDLIERLARLVPAGESTERGEIVLSLGDDAAVLEPRPGMQLVATVDTLMEGIHFRRDWTSAEDLGWKSLAVNVSDAAAMGAAPWVALVSLALPPHVTVEWVESLYRGLAACAARYGCAIVGGDTVGSNHDVAITVALLGTAAPPEICLRSGARPGDLVCVTGTLGDSAAGLALLQAEYHPEATPEWRSLYQAHRRPEPPLAAARALAADAAITAMMDLSDGLASDLRHICARSGVGARVRAADLPISPAARAAASALGADPFDWALRGGEDYQLLFTLHPQHSGHLSALLADTGTQATILGEITGSGYTLVRLDGHEEPLSPQAFDHFEP